MSKGILIRVGCVRKTFAHGTIRAVESDGTSCEGCALEQSNDCYLYECEGDSRADGKYVIFEKV